MEDRANTWRKTQKQYNNFSKLDKHQSALFNFDKQMATLLDQIRPLQNSGKYQSPKLGHFRPFIFGQATLDGIKFRNVKTFMHPYHFLLVNKTSF